MIPADSSNTPQQGTARAAVASAWRAAWSCDMGVWASTPEGPAHTVTVVPARVPGRTVIRPLRTPPGARHRAGTVTS